MKKRNGTLSMPGGLAWGGGMSLGVTLLGAGALTWLVDREILPMEKIGYGILVLLLLASNLGAVTALGKLHRRRLLVCLASGGVYFGLLLSITALFFGGQYSGVGTTALLVLAGSATAALLGPGQGRGGRRGKIRIPLR